MRPDCARLHERSRRNHARDRFPGRSASLFRQRAALNVWLWRLRVELCVSGGLMSWLRLPLFFGTLKIKPRRHLRREEIHRTVPVVKIGNAYFVWKSHAPRRRSQGAPEKQNSRSVQGDLHGPTLETPYRSTHRLCPRGAAVKNLARSASFHSNEKTAPSKSGIKLQ